MAAQAPILQLYPLFHPGQIVATPGALELLAFLIGGGSQIEIARALLRRLGSLSSLVRATPNELRGTLGVGPTTGARFRAALELVRRLGKPDDDAPPRIQSPDEPPTCSCITYDTWSRNT